MHAPLVSSRASPFDNDFLSSRWRNVTRAAHVNDIARSFRCIDIGVVILKDAARTGMKKRVARSDVRTFGRTCHIEHAHPPPVHVGEVFEHVPAARNFGSRTAEALQVLAHLRMDGIDVDFGTSVRALGHGVRRREPFDSLRLGQFKIGATGLERMNETLA